MLDCDAKGHSANFLVARHSRSLLCDLCHSRTPWTGLGPKLWPSTASSCGRCSSKQEDDDLEEGVRD
ncbi:hypothetical protein KIW84_UN0917 [Lathyrus oleraceus]|nr:hypothetical protein KIW84_UN0917 [Pisum sativum]